MRERGLSIRSTILVPVIGLLASALLLAGCGSQAKPKGPITFKDDNGTTVTLKRPAHRIIALGPSDAEIVLALGLKRDLAGADADSFTYLPAPYRLEMKGVRNVGNAVTTPNLEAIAALRPDLVLAIYDAPYVSKLRSLGLKVAVLDPATVAQIEADIEKVGLATGDVGGAHALVRSMRTKIAAISRAAAATGKRPRVFVELDPTLYTVGPGSFIDALVTLAHGTNIVDALSHEAYPQVSSEQVITADPNVIVLQDQGFGGSAKIDETRPGWNTIAAIRDGEIVSSVSPDLLSNPGPAVVKGLWELAQAIHPGLHLPPKDQ